MFIVGVRQVLRTTAQVLMSTMYLVDLAGSERARTAKTEGKHFREMVHINQSLTTLARVIKSLADGDKVVPYRDSTLTGLLESAFVGNCRTSLLVACSQHPSNIAESLASLRFAETAFQLKTTVTIERRSVASIRKELHERMERVLELISNMEERGHTGAPLYIRHLVEYNQLTRKLRLMDHEARNGRR